MKKKTFYGLLLLPFLLASCGKSETPSFSEGGESSPLSSSPISSALSGENAYGGSSVLVSQKVTENGKTTLQVEGHPFLYEGIQLRVDAFMNCDGYSYDKIEPLFEKAAALGVSCVQVPLEWADIEIENDVWDDTYLAEMLSFAQKYDLKMEFLWYGSNMCGDTHSYTVPDYILRDGKTYPKYDGNRVGEFWNYYGVMWFLDFDNAALLAQEARALTHCLDYVYEWDGRHGQSKNLIGVQILNEPDIFVRWRIEERNVLALHSSSQMTLEEGWEKVRNSLDYLGKAVKKCKYQVFTRTNLASSTAAGYSMSANGIYSGNEVKDPPDWAKRIAALEGIDFIGDDVYRSLVKDVKGVATMYGAKLPGNFSLISENDGGYSNTASLILASLACGAGYSIYELATSPFFLANNSANIEQGICTVLSDGSLQEKAHFAEVHSILDGLKKAGTAPVSASVGNILVFNAEGDYPKQSVSQDIASASLQAHFVTANKALGFLVDTGKEALAYFTQDAVLTLSNATFGKAQAGAYAKDGSFSVTSETDLSNGSFACVKETLYRLSYSNVVKPLTSTAWEEIGL